MPTIIHTSVSYPSGKLSGRYPSSPFSHSGYYIFLPRICVPPPPSWSSSVLFFVLAPVIIYLMTIMEEFKMCYHEWSKQYKHKIKLTYCTDQYTMQVKIPVISTVEVGGEGSCLYGRRSNFY